MDVPSQIRGARTLLQRALGPGAAVNLESFTMDRTEQRTALAKLALQDGRVHELEVLPWGHAREGTEDRHRVWVLERSGEALRDRLRRAGTNFIELEGEVHLALPSLLIDRERLGAVRDTLKRPTNRRNPFSDRSSLVTRALLDGPRSRTWMISELAEAAGVSEATASYVIRSLRGWGFVDYSRPGRHASVRLSDPLGLIAKWTSRYDWAMNVRLPVHAPIGSPDRFLRRLGSRLTEVRFAYTLHAGASLVAPHARWEKVHLYLDVESDDALADFAARQDWEPAESGRLVLMRPLYRDSAFRDLQRENGLPVVSTLQLVLDLWHYPLRGREQAEHLTEKVLAPVWAMDES